MVASSEKHRLFLLKLSKSNPFRQKMRQLGLLFPHFADESRASECVFSGRLTTAAITANQIVCPLMIWIQEI